MVNDEDANCDAMEVPLNKQRKERKTCFLFGVFFFVFFFGVWVGGVVVVAKKYKKYKKISLFVIFVV